MIVAKPYRAMACKSFCGFQSESKMITMSAAVRFNPSPPVNVTIRTFVNSRKAPRTRPCAEKHHKTLASLSLESIDSMKAQRS
jgi:hypothetical protein